MKITARVFLAFALFAAGIQAAPVVSDKLELDIKSEFSHIKVTRQGSTKTLWFVRDNGEEVIESRIDLKQPHRMLIEYVRFMFLSYLFRPEPKQVLIVGLGGGAMVHFFHHYDPKVKIEAVEIDPKIVEISQKQFAVPSNARTKLIAADGLVYLRESKTKYDVIYMDAFLRPSGSTDDTGVPLGLKTLEFYGEVKRRLNPNGVVVFNLNPHALVQEDIRMIRKAFPNTYLFRLSYDGGFVVVASTSPTPLSAKALLENASKLDRRFKAEFSFKTMTEQLAQ